MTGLVGAFFRLWDRVSLISGYSRLLSMVGIHVLRSTFHNVRSGYFFPVDLLTRSYYNSLLHIRLTRKVRIATCQPPPAETKSKPKQATATVPKLRMLPATAKLFTTTL